MGLLSDAKLASYFNTSRVYYMYPRVRACKPSLLEGNCTSYPNGYYKPTGQIQNNAKNLNFAAFGYLNDNNIQRDGGVLRARMSSIHPTGSNPEWNPNTGQFLLNPNPSDAAKSGVSNSGVINYLNKFGLNKPGYKYYDPVSELYYTVGRYFRHKDNVEAYTKNLNNIMKDGFPVITDWYGDADQYDPIKLSCETNFIIGVGDTNTHADANLPGSTISSSDEPPLPSEVGNDYGSLTDTATHFTDVKTSTNYIGNLHGIGNIGNSAKPWCCNTSTFFMAGIAYDLHTRDIRPDIKGKQTVTTYWLDTLEVGDRKDFGVVGMRNQFWLTAKYGGFSVPENYDAYKPSNTDPKRSNWDINNDDDPDNYYRVNNPQSMLDGLNDAFTNIVALTEATSTGFELSSPQIQSDSLSFSSRYSTKNWVGSMHGSTINFDASGDPVSTEVWSTNTTLEAQASGNGWDTKRFIATANCVKIDADGNQQCTGIPFRYSSLDNTSKSALNIVGTASGVGAIALNYLRGDKSKEDIFRTRSVLLGDIVHSKIRAVGAPNARYSESTNAGYGTFKSTHANRPTVAYIGANDGMLHAFDGKSGNELFAYVPNALFKGPSNTPDKNGLASLANNNYIHHYFVDSTPVVYDVKFQGGSWHSLLIGGLGKGGKSYYALDVSNPSSLSNETNLANAVKWEFTHKDLGYSYGQPVVVKTDSGKWVVIITSGYNNATGRGYFFILDAETGVLLNKVSTGVGSASNEAGLAHATAFITDARNFVADAAYAGDLLGNVWRLDLSGITKQNYSLSPIRLATLKSASGTIQPITISPVIEFDQQALKRILFVGTGRLLTQSDLEDHNPQSFYAIYDGFDNDFYTNSTLPGSISYPINPRSVMVDHTNNINSVILDNNKPMGYFIDLASEYKMSTPMSSATGTIAFSAQKLAGDTCDIDAYFRGYALNYASGNSVLTINGSLLSTQFFQGTGTVSAVQIYRKQNGQNASVNFSTSDTGLNVSIDIQSSPTAFKLLNWRAIPNEN